MFRKAYNPQWEDYVCTDAEAFLLRTETDPGFLDELSGMFTSRKEHHPKPFFEVTDMNVAAFHVWLANEWSDMPEAVSAIVLAQRIGVSTNSINYLVREGKLAAVTVMGKRLCIKQSVIDYYASAEKLSHPTEEYINFSRPLFGRPFPWLRFCFD